MTVLSQLVMAVCVVTSLGAPAMTVVDLTHQLGKDSLFWPGQPPFNFTILHRGYYQVWKTWFENNHLAVAEHGGTHIDAPAHFAEGHWRTHEIPASHLVGPGVIVDVTDKVKDNSDYAVTVGDLKAWEDQYGRIPDGAVVLMKSGWSKRYPDAKRMFGTETPEDDTTYHFPGFDEDAARWLAEERSVVAVGADTPTPDPGIKSHSFPVHQVLLPKDVVLLEFVANVESLPPSGATIVIGVVNLRDGSGGPARIMGLIGPDADTSGCAAGLGEGMGLAWLLSAGVLLTNRIARAQ
ncbi:hypothetical protein BaRGS_00012056 [Batillaria attramentaria]|uniref:Cyclase n=1 Tax=Batillaria attramentaria TaxID=370345 RepID=A0ABD0LB10_9CAEN